MDLTKLFFVDGVAFVTVALPTLMIAMSVHTRMRGLARRAVVVKISSTV